MDACFLCLRRVRRVGAVAAVAGQAQQVLAGLVPHPDLLGAGHVLHRAALRALQQVPDGLLAGGARRPVVLPGDVLSFRKSQAGSASGLQCEVMRQSMRRTFSRRCQKRSFPGVGCIKYRLAQRTRANALRNSPGAIFLPPYTRRIAVRSSSSISSSARGSTRKTPSSITGGSRLPALGLSLQVERGVDRLLQVPVPALHGEVAARPALPADVRMDDLVQGVVTEESQHVRALRRRVRLVHELPDKAPAPLVVQARAQLLHPHAAALKPPQHAEKHGVRAVGTHEIGREILVDHGGPSSCSAPQPWPSARAHKIRPRVFPPLGILPRYPL